MSRCSRHVCALAVAASLGCNAIAGINDPVDPPSGSSGTPPGGSSGASSGGDASLARFVGTWRNVRRLTTSCGAAQQETAAADLDAFELQITTSDSGLVIALTYAPTCRLGTTVSGDVATFASGQECRFASASATAVYSYSDASTFTLTSATTAELDIAAIAQQEGASDLCAYAEVSLLEKQ